MNIGDYIRTPFGITKCSDKHQIIIEDDLFGETKYGYLYYLEDYDDEICNITDSNLNEYKHSPNIIDLIEAGDYVNGKLVIEHAYQKGRLFVTNLYIGGKGFTTCEDYSWELTKENEDYIDSILTKEQFESMEYKVVE